MAKDNMQYNKKIIYVIVKDILQIFIKMINFWRKDLNEI